MKHAGVCGNFGAHNNISNGQIIKTRVLADQLKTYFGEQEIIILNTFEWKKTPIKLFIECIRLIFLCNNIVILPAQNGIKIIAPLFATLCELFNKKLHYSVIGGWLPEFLQEHQRITESIKKMHAVYVETQSMKQGLIELGLENVVHMPNFKNIKLVSINEMPDKYTEPYPLCTFSRVTKEKGIIDAITAVKELNEKMGKRVFSIDIYGAIEAGFENELNNAILNSNGCAQYKGQVDFNKSTEKLKKYFALVFPTYYVGEGFPGTIIDAFSSGLPVIATDWRYNSELVSNGKTGFIYRLYNEKQRGLLEVLECIYNKPEVITAMKRNCLQEAKKYDASVVMRQMLQKMEV